MSTADSGYTATDIITYIGVPLAVLGVLPILYNTAATLTSLSKIKRMLRHSRLTALTRSDVVNRVIEVELPRYAVRPWDRFDNRSEYWQISRQPSQIPGGTWTTFNWRFQTVGLKTQRVEYADQLRQPQVDVAFDELVCYLLDLGAVPDPHGWRLLRSTGLWTPVGSALLMSPDGIEKALTIAPLDDSDGHLSLKVHWRPDWTSRDYSHLPPYWVRLPSPPAEATGEGHGEGSGSAKADAPANPTKEKEDNSSIRKESLDSAQQEINSNRRAAITCQISGNGLVSAMTRGNCAQSNPSLDSLYIEHLRIQPASTVGTWFASATTAYGRTSQTVLWNYRVPEDVLSFARKDTVPCGVLEVLGVVTPDDTPEWATKYPADHMNHLEVHVRRMNEQRAAMAAEALMAPAQREAAARDRMRRETEARLQEQRGQLRIASQRKDTRLAEAIQSPRWDVGRVAAYNLAWLKSNGHVASDCINVKDVVGGLLHRMVLEGEFAKQICAVLDMWKAWADNGGMRRSDFEALKDDKVAFAYATFLVALIRDISAALDGTLSVDLQECLTMWRQVRLG
jgi:hypothetical protein